MATHTGSEGTVHFGANAIAEIRSFSIDQTGDTVEDTTMGDTDRTYIKTLKTFSGSVDVFWDETDTNGQLSMEVHDTGTINVYPEGSTSGDNYYTGSIIVTGFNITSSFDGMVEASISFQGTGALTRGDVA